MNKVKDNFESKAYLKGYDNFIWERSKAVCPYKEKSEEAKCWHLGYEDAKSFVAPESYSDIGDW